MAFVPCEWFYEHILGDKGNSAYLNQEHIDCLIKMERKQMFNEAVKDVMNSFSCTDAIITGLQGRK